MDWGGERLGRESRRLNSDPHLPFRVAVVGGDPRHWQAFGIMRRGVCLLSLRFPPTYPFSAPSAVVVNHAFAPTHATVDSNTGDFCIDGRRDWSPSMCGVSFLLNAWSLLLQSESWAPPSVAAPFQTELLRRVWGTAYRKLAPNTSHTDASLATLDPDELRAMTEGHPSAVFPTGRVRRTTLAHLLSAT